MNNDFFQVKPVQSYDGAQYPSAYAHDPGDDDLEKRIHPLTILMALVLVLGLTFGTMGCYLKNNHTPDDPVPDGGTGDGGPDPDCDEDERRCTEGENFEICDDGEWVTTICEDWCDENYGHEAYAAGCDADAEQPCLCEYDILAGDPDPCYPNELFCSGERTLVLCSEDWREVDCDEYCRETHEGSSEWYSNGCDQNNADNPCQCEYGVIDGFMPECEPGDVVCVEDWSVDICIDGYEHRVISCNEYCQETHDGSPEWYSNGCDNDAEDICQCEYGMLDGEMMECMPEDVMCIDDDTLQTCEDGMFIHQDCDERCAELYGEGAASEGCDIDSDEPCQCVSFSDSGGEK